MYGRLNLLVIAAVYLLWPNYVGREWVPVKSLTSERVGTTVLVRGRLHNSRGTGKNESLLLSCMNC